MTNNVKKVNMIVVSLALMLLSVIITAIIFRYFEMGLSFSNFFGFCVVFLLLTHLLIIPFETVFLYRLSPHSFVVDEDDGNRVIFENNKSTNVTFWKSQFLKNCVSRSLPKDQEVELSFGSIDENLVGRKLTITVFCRNITGEHVLALGKGSLKKKIEFQLYEFNQKTQAELSKLYNPADPKQQKKINVLLLRFFEENFPEIQGAKIFVEFSVFER